jgi:hypothetical protein
MRLAWDCQQEPSEQYWNTYIFDLGTWVNSDDVAVLHAEIVADYSVHACASIVEVIVGQDDQDSILPLLAFD